MRRDAYASKVFTGAPWPRFTAPHGGVAQCVSTPPHGLSRLQRRFISLSQALIGPSLYLLRPRPPIDPLAAHGTAIPAFLCRRQAESAVIQHRAALGRARRIRQRRSSCGTEGKRLAVGRGVCGPISSYGPMGKLVDAAVRAGARTPASVRLRNRPVSSADFSHRGHLRSHKRCIGLSSATRGR